MSSSLCGPRLGSRVALRPATHTVSLRAQLQAPHRPRRLQVCAALHDPWATLGVSRNASEKEVKQAHRRLVKQHHPDVRRGEDLVAQAQFLRIQEAYELIMGKRAGKDVEGRPTEKSSWDFHDWFWSFKMKRKQGVREQAATFRSQWQAQMAGLKQKAAAKRWKQGRRRPAAAAGPATEGTPAAAAAASGAAAGGPASSPAARERVWRSMTKNARNADKAAAERAAAQQTLGATGRGAPQAVGAGSQPPPQQAQQAPQPRHAQPQQAQQAAAAAQHTQQHSAADEAHSHSGHSSSSSSSSSHAARLRQLMEHAAELVRGRQPGAGAHAASSAHAHAASDAHAHTAHAQPEEAAGHAPPGRHWRGHMTLDQLASLLGGGSAGNAVPADQQLHRRFEAARRAQHEQHSAAAASVAEQPEAAAGEEGVQAEAEPQHSHHQHYEQHHYEQHHYGGAHARKFANRSDVEERLSTQLAGLKRRAALKQEVQSSC